MPELAARLIMLKRIRTASLPFVLALLLLGIPQITVAQSIQELFQQGVEAVTAGRYIEAEQIFRQIIQLDPNNADAYNDLGVALTTQGKLDEAITNYQKAISLEPDDAHVYNNLGNALKDQGELDEAIANYRKAISLKPDHAGAYNNLGYALSEQGDLDEAITAYKRAIAIAPNYATAQNNLKEAERLSAINLAIKLNPVPTNIDDRQYLPSEKDEPLVSVLRSTVRIIVAGLPEQNPYPGAGWVIKREKDTVWIITNRHVISDNTTRKPLEKIEVEFYSEPPKDILRPRYSATLVQMSDPNDRTLDLAVLKVTGIPDDIKTLKLRPGRVRRLASVIVIGHPYNRDNPWDTVRGTVTSQGDTLPIDANVATGNSGGPIIDEQTREVIGILFAIRDPSDPARPEEIASLDGMRGTEGVGVAYHIDVVIRQLQEWGILSR